MTIDDSKGKNQKSAWLNEAKHGLPIRAEEVCYTLAGCLGPCRLRRRPRAFKILGSQQYEIHTFFKSDFIRE